MNHLLDALMYTWEWARRERVRDLGAMIAVNVAAAYHPHREAE